MANSRVDFVNHKGKRILLIDFTQMRPDEHDPIIERIRTMVSNEPKGSALTLIDATGMRLDIKMVQALKELANQDKPYVRASAAVGVGGPLGLLMDGVEKFSGRTFQRHETREQALDWLARQ
jgi:hypothetical protein